MLAFYTETQHNRFTDRREPLARLHYLKAELQEGIPGKLALWGMRRIGKTALLKEFIWQIVAAGEGEVQPIYVNLEEISGAPELFTAKFIGQICYWTLHKGQGDPLPFLNPHDLRLQIPPEETFLREVAERLDWESQRAQFNRTFLLDLALSLPERLAMASGRKFIVILDEFPALLYLENYPDIPPVLGIFRGQLERQANCAWVIAGSAITMMEQMLSSHESPLFAQFDKLLLSPLEEKDSLTLGEKIIGNLPEDAGRELHRLTGGHPFYLTVLAERLKWMTELEDMELSPAVVQHAFITETLSPEGKINDFCRYIYEVSIQKARGYGSLMTVLDILAREEGLTASQVSKQLRVAAATARQYLRWLKDVDLLYERERRFYFRDPVLRFWLLRARSGGELPGLPKESWETIFSHLTERFQSATRELGLAKESQIRELMRNFAGQIVEGTLFGVEGKVLLPTFTSVMPYRSPDNLIEIDALAKNGETWAVEVKWQNRLASVRDLRKFKAHASSLAGRFWFIAKKGFKSEAITFARQEGIMLSTEKEVQELAEKLGLRFGK